MDLLIFGICLVHLLTFAWPESVHNEQVLWYRSWGTISNMIGSIVVTLPKRTSGM